MLIWLHARDSTQSSLHSSFCTHFSSPLISFAIVRAAHSVDIQYVSLVKSSHSVCQIPLMLQISVLLCFPPLSSVAWGDAEGHFSARTWKGFHDIPADGGITASVCLRHAHTHFRGSTSHFTACWVTWCDTSAVYWQIWYSWARSAFLPGLCLGMLYLLHTARRWKPTLWALFCLEKKKAAALNLHGSSHTLPQVPVEAG